MIRALAMAVLATAAQAQEAPGSIPVPLTAAETAALRVAVAACWNVAAMDPAARRTVVEVALTLDADARPVADSIRLHAGDPAAPEATEQAFRAARRAILRCGQAGFPLPSEKAGEWRKMILTFDPRQAMLR